MTDKTKIVGNVKGVEELYLNEARADDYAARVIAPASFTACARSLQSNTNIIHITNGRVRNGRIQEAL